MKALLLCLIPLVSLAEPLSDADLQREAAAVRKRQPSDGFTVLVQRPFVVAGDEGATIVKQRAKATVKWAVDKLKQDFFTKEPTEIITIWLFKDDESYRRNAKKLFGDSPDTPYGYYLPSKNAMVMNISTGGGTLVHEIVHPFMRANFPKCPAWFNEGLGSLFEQATERDGHIVGLTNWRLSGLQRAIEQGSVPSLTKLMKTSDEAFYGDDRGIYYAEARYLLYYLQEKGLLREFYRRFVVDHAIDKTGTKTLKKVLNTTDLAGFQKDWESYVMTLTFDD